MKNIRLYYVSDLHLEFLITQKGLDLNLLAYYNKIFQNTIQSLNDSYQNVLLIAGDFAYAKHFHYFQHFLSEIVSHFDLSYLLLGNHDYWHSCVSFNKENNAFKKMNEVIQNHYILKNKLVLLENIQVSLNEKYDLFGCTLWYKVEPQYQYKVKQEMNDFKYIKSRDFKKISYFDFESIYYKSLECMKKSIEQSYLQNKKIVVATHHGTSENYLKFTPYTDCLAYANVLPHSLFHINSEERDYALIDTVKCFIHGHSHIKSNIVYQNEFNIDTYMNTIGYLNEETFFVKNEEQENELNKAFNAFKRVINLENYTLPFILLD